MPFLPCILSPLEAALQQKRLRQVLESIPVEHHTCSNLSGTEVSLLALIELTNISLFTQRGRLIGVRRKSAEKKSNIRGVSELIRVVAGLLTHHFCHRLCRAIDKAQRICPVKELIIESDHTV